MGHFKGPNFPEGRNPFVMARENSLLPTGALCSVLLVLLGAACKAPPLVQGTVQQNTITTTFDWDAYALGAGDVIAINVFKHPEFSTPERGERVDLRGTISLPLIGPVKIDGQSAEGARALITEALSEYLVDPAVTVSIIEYGSQRVYIFGQVDVPGSYALDRPINALQALTLGQGFRVGADRETVALMRASGNDLEVHYFNAETPGVDGLVAVQPGDFIFVRESGSGRFREQVLPYIAGAAPIIGAFTNLAVISDALDD